MWVDGIKKLFKSKKREKVGQFVTAVDHVTFKVEKGEFFGILGPNGAGKTTLVKLLCCILRAEEGTALVNGYDINRERYQVKASVSLVAQAGWRFFSYAQSVKENLELTAALYGLPRKETEQRVTQALKTVGLWDRRDSSPMELSSGMRQKLVLAKGFLFKTPIFILDEPTVGLDPPSAVAVRSYVKKELNKELGQTVLMTTHLMEEADMLCDRVAIMEKGRIVACGSPEELKKALQKEEILEIEVTNYTGQILDKIKKLRLVSRASARILDATLGYATIRVHSPEIEDVLPSVIRLIEMSGGKVVYLKEVKPSLEDVYLKTVGKGL